MYFWGIQAPACLHQLSLIRVKAGGFKTRRLFLLRLLLLTLSACLPLNDLFQTGLLMSRPSSSSVLNPLMKDSLRTRRNQIKLWMLPVLFAVCLCEEVEHLAAGEMLRKSRHAVFTLLFLCSCPCQHDIQSLIQRLVPFALLKQHHFFVFCILSAPLMISRHHSHLKVLGILLLQWNTREAFYSKVNL